MHFTDLAMAAALVGAARSDNIASPPVPTRATMLDSHMVAALEVLGKKPSDLRLPGSRPAPDKPAGTDLLPGIENIIMIMFENHSFDNVLGLLDRDDVDGMPMGEDGLPSPVSAFSNGTLVRAYKAPMTCQRTSPGDAPTQNWGSAHVHLNNGTNDGFVWANGNLTDGNKTISMAYFTESQLPFLHSIAKVFPICDRWFGSVAGPTWPNRMYAIGGTSLGITTTHQSLNNTVVPDHHSFFATLDEYNITWRHYLPGLGNPDAISTLDRFPLDNDTAQAHTVERDQFYDDAAKGLLPQYTFIDVNGTLDSQEAPQNIVNGDATFSAVIKAIGDSPQWNKTLLIMTYDEDGGYFDHVLPPVALAPDDIAAIPPEGYWHYSGFKQYGYRVPAMVISPFAKKNYVVHKVHDHTSILAMLQRKWNLPAMSFRDANANDMTDFIDLEALALGRMNFPDLQALNLSAPGNTTEALACDGGTNIILPPPEAYHEPAYVFPL